MFDIIPEGRLQETFDRAFLAHDSSFPVSAYDLKDAWKEIAAQEKADQPIPTVKEIPIPVKYCVNRGRHTNDNGDVLDSLLDPPMELPCEFCRPIHRKERLQELEAQAVFEASAEC